MRGDLEHLSQRKRVFTRVRDAVCASKPRYCVNLKPENDLAIRLKTSCSSSAFAASK